MTSSRPSQGGTVTSLPDARNGEPSRKSCNLAPRSRRRDLVCRRTKSLGRLRSRLRARGTRSRAARLAALWPLRAHAHGRVGRARRSGQHRLAADQLRRHDAAARHADASGAARPLRARLAAPGVARPGSARSRRRRPPLRRAARGPPARARRGRRPPSRRRTASARLELRALYEQGNVDPVAVMLGASLAQHGPQPARRPVARRRPEPPDRCSRRAAAHRRLLGRNSCSRRRLGGSPLARRRAAGRAESRRGAAAAGPRTCPPADEGAAAGGAGAERRGGRHRPPSRSRRRCSRPTTAPPPSGRGRQIVVSATCYDLPGKTATGMPVGRASSPSIPP